MSSVDEIATSKQRLRVELQRTRSARPAADLEAARAAIRSVAVPRLRSVDCVAAYQPLRTEPGSVQLLAALTECGVRVLVPVTLPDRDLDWAVWAPAGQLEPLGLAAIAAARVVLVPALAVAADGTRLGRGGGSYDRALPRCTPGTRVAAVLFDGELVPELPRQPWDRPVTAVVSPAGWVELDRNTDVAERC